MKNRFQSDETLTWECNLCRLPNLTDSYFCSSDSEISVGSNVSEISKGSENRTKPNKTQLKCLTVNCRSLKSIEKQICMMDLIETHKPDIICATETHLNSSISNSEILPPDFSETTYRRDRNERGGGVLIAVHKSILASDEPSLDTNSEIKWVKIHSNHAQPLFISCFYRPPSSDKTAIEELNKSVCRLTNSNKIPNVLLTGDFNMPGIDWKSGTIKSSPQYGSDANQSMLSAIQDCCMVQSVEQPTRGKNVLDLVFTTNENIITSCETVPGMSDHQAVVTNINLKAKLTKQKPRTVYLYGKGNMENIKSDIRSLSDKFKEQPENSVNEMWDEFKTTLNDSINKNVPQKQLSQRKNLPWLTKEIKRKINQKRRAYRKMKRTNLVNDKQRFEKLRKEIKCDLRNEHNKYIENLFECKKTDDSKEQYSISKKFWSYIKGRRKENTSIPILREGSHETSDPKEIANILNRQYESVFTEDDTNIPDKGISKTPAMPHIQFTTNGIEKQLHNLEPRKASGPDQVSARILKETAKESATVLTSIFQKSYDTGHLPEDWKTANVSAIFKKGDKKDPANYRPVSLTSICCKVMEHVLCCNILKHLESFDILSDNQHGFRARRSCETQLIQTIQDLAKSVSDKRQIDMAILDLRKLSTRCLIQNYSIN